MPQSSTNSRHIVISFRIIGCSLVARTAACERLASETASHRRMRPEAGMRSGSEARCARFPEASPECGPAAGDATPGLTAEDATSTSISSAGQRQNGTIAASPPKRLTGSGSWLAG